MDANPWLSDPTEVAQDIDHTAEGDSLGDQIDSAIGEFDAKLARVLEELDLKRSEVADLEALIEETEKLQAKAFKDLLSKNKQIRKMLAPGKTARSKKSATRRRKTKSDEPRPSDPGPSTTGLPYTDPR